MIKDFILGTIFFVPFYFMIDFFSEIDYIIKHLAISIIGMNVSFFITLIIAFCLHEVYKFVHRKG